MVKPAVGNAWFRWLDKARICEANPSMDNSAVIQPNKPSIWRICKQIRALSRQRSRKSSTVGYSTVSEALTETGPGHHEGNSGVSVKPPLLVSPAAQPRLCRNFWLDRKSTRLNSSHV